MECEYIMNIGITGYLEVDEQHIETAKQMIEEVLFDLPFEIYVEFEG